MFKDASAFNFDLLIEMANYMYLYNITLDKILYIVCYINLFDACSIYATCSYKKCLLCKKRYHVVTGVKHKNHALFYFNPCGDKPINTDRALKRL